MNFLEELKSLGVDVDGGLNRLGGNESLYKRLMGIFTKTIKEYDVPVDFDGNNYKDIIEKAHAIKGASGNLSITPIYDAYTKIVELLRADQPEQAREVLVNVQPIQGDIVQCIEKHMQ